MFSTAINHRKAKNSPKRTFAFKKNCAVPAERHPKLQCYTIDGSKTHCGLPSGELAESIRGNLLSTQQFPASLQYK